MRTIAVVATMLLMSLAGCGPAIQPSVYGLSGKAYQAPTMCGALALCLKSEPGCYQDVTTFEQAGTTQVSKCEKVTK